MSISNQAILPAVLFSFLQYNKKYYSVFLDCKKEIFVLLWPSAGNDMSFYLITNQSVNNHLNCHVALLAYTW